MATLTENFPTDPRAVAAELDESGWVCVENAVSPDWMARAQDHVHGLLEKHGEKFFVIIRPADEENSLASELAHHPRMQELLRTLTEIGCPEGVVEWEDVYNTLRVVAGPGGQKGSREFHYDAGVITALVPICIPDQSEGPSGELAIFPNKRRYRSLLGNLVEKAVVQSGPYRRRMLREVERDRDANCRTLKPGNLYLFWGYRSYHGNMPCRPNSVRATMLLHYGNPHGRSTLLQGFRGIRKAIETWRLAHGDLPAKELHRSNFPRLTEESGPSELPTHFSPVDRTDESPRAKSRSANPAEDAAVLRSARPDPVEPR